MEIGKLGNIKDEMRKMSVNMRKMNVNMRKMNVNIIGLCETRMVEPGKCTQMILE